MRTTVLGLHGLRRRRVGTLFENRHPPEGLAGAQKLEDDFLSAA
jgi:hypothetical protein